MRYRGTGPGEITPDGCPVELYARLPLMGEPEIIHSAIPAGSSILELGCGTGRLLRALAAQGHPVVAVDESPAMLARVSDLSTVRATIEDLDLQRPFDAVVLASTLLNAPPVRRRSFLAACRRHLAPGGVLVVQQTPPEWFATIAPSSRERDGIRVVVASVVRREPQVEVTVEYHTEGQTWTHSFDRWPVPDLRGDLAAAGLRFGRWLTEDHAWFTAQPHQVPE
jgi:SAM-dependent methyltransferase